MMAPEIKKRGRFSPRAYERVYGLSELLSIGEVPLKMKVLRLTGEGSPETLRFQDPNVENEKSTSTRRIFTMSRMKTIFEFGYAC